MYYNDHAPPHFHAKYGDEEAAFRTDNGQVLEGAAGSRARRLVEEWWALHQAELAAAWERARARQELGKIAPLD